MLKIWGRNNSVNVQKVLWCAGELGLHYQRIDAGLQFGGNHEAWYLKMNPNGLVPTIDDDGLILWESNTIVRYLAAKYSGGRLYPTDLSIRAQAERWMDWVLSTLNSDMRTIFWGWVRTPPAKRDLDALEKTRQSLCEIWARLDGCVANRDYVAGTGFTMGDIPVGAWAYRWFTLPIERPDLPNLRAWYDRLTERPAYRECVMPPLT